jgi:homoserine/homoserine lactone efflux protein
MTIQIYLTYLLTCIAITIIPGPTVTLIIANSLSPARNSALR